VPALYKKKRKSHLSYCVCCFYDYDYYYQQNFFLQESKIDGLLILYIIIIAYLYTVHTLLCVLVRSGT